MDQLALKATMDQQITPGIRIVDTTLTHAYPSGAAGCSPAHFFDDLYQRKTNTNLCLDDRAMEALLGEIDAFSRLLRSR